jgi:hypothetical protein
MSVVALAAAAAADAAATAEEVGVRNPVSAMQVAQANPAVVALGIGGQQMHAAQVQPVQPQQSLSLHNELKRRACLPLPIGYPSTTPHNGDVGKNAPQLKSLHDITLDEHRYDVAGDLGVGVQNSAIDEAKRQILMDKHR